ncbi:MAG: creatininase family protein [Armatimonadota bacterium]
MSDPSALHRQPLLLKYLAPDEVRTHLQRDPRLIVPVGTTEQHGAHLPLGCDTIIVERLADDLSAAFRVLRAPTIEYGVNAATFIHYPGSASIRRKTLHRLLNDLVGSWEAGGVEQFIILTAHGQDPHQEALSTLRTRRASVRTVDILAVPLSPGDGHARAPIHGGELDTSLLLYVDAGLVDLQRAQDYEPSRSAIRRYHRGIRGAIPKESPGSLGRPSLASVEKGQRLYQFIYDRIAMRLFGVPSRDVHESG